MYHGPNILMYVIIWVACNLSGPIRYRVDQRKNQHVHFRNILKNVPCKLIHRVLLVTALTLWLRPQLHLNCFVPAENIVIENVIKWIATCTCDATYYVIAIQ